MPAKSRTELSLRTARLELVAATLELVEAEIGSRARLAALIEAVVESWPPPLNDENSLRWTLEKLRNHPEQAGFFAWYVILVGGERRLVGIAGFKGPPDPSGTIEVGYSVVREWQRQGIASEATRALIEWGFRQTGVEQITAETLPELLPSIRVMKRCGMSFLGVGSEPATIRYGIRKEQWRQ